MVELIDLIEEEIIIRRFAEAYNKYVEDNYSDIPTQPMSFKQFVEQSIYFVVMGDNHRLQLLLGESDSEVNDLILDTFDGTNYIRPTKENNYVYRVTFIQSCGAIYIERDIVSLEHFVVTKVIKCPIQN